MTVSTSVLVAPTADVAESPDQRRARIEEIFDACAVGLYRYVAVRVGQDSALADDIMQQLWVQIGRSKRHVPTQECEYWLRAIAKNLIASHWRRSKRRPKHLPLDSPDVAGALAARLDTQLLPDEIVERRELRDHLALAVTELDAGDQELIIRHYVQGQLFQEISEALEISERAVEGRLYRARQQLKRKLEHLREGLS